MINPKTKTIKRIMNKREEIRGGIKEILVKDLIIFGSTHENPPPGEDCGDECGVSFYDQTAASNPIFAPMRSGGDKHKKCMDCWDEYIEELTTRILTVIEGNEGVYEGTYHSESATTNNTDIVHYPDTQGSPVEWQ